MLRSAGWTVNKKRVERIWRCEGLKVPAKQPKRGRLWLDDGSCVRLRPQRPNHVWSYDFVADRTHDGKAFRMLCIIDEFTRESLAQQRVGVRKERSRPLVVALETWLREQRGRVSKNSYAGKAIDYSLKRWAALTRFLDDGRPCMTNNAAERELRAIAIGRRN
jgi:hypothetical protein